MSDAPPPPPPPGNTPPPPPPGGSPPPPGPDHAMTPEERSAAMMLHLSALAGLMIGFFFLVPLIIWLVKRNDMPAIDPHGKAAINWHLSMFIWTMLSVLLICAGGIGIVLLILIGLISIIFPIIAAVKANDGELWEYPGTFHFIK